MKINLSFEAKQSGTELHIFSCFNKAEESKVAKKVATKKPVAKKKARKTKEV